MPNIYYKNQAYPINDNETLLDALLKHEINFPHSCKIGTCQSCLTQLVSGTILPAAQKGLKPTLAAKNYFLACQCKSNHDITITLPEENDTSISSKIVALSMLNYNVLRVRLAIEGSFDFKAGQYINLITPENVIRSYSIANVPTCYIELHVKLMPSGLMSTWLSKQAKIGSPVYIRGPIGNCFYYNPGQRSFPIVLAGTGTGLAPLIGIANDALKCAHKGEITLIHGGVNDVDLYYHEALKALQSSHANFTYIPCVLNNSTSIKKASIDNVLIEKLENIKNDVQLFICGPEETTKKLKTKAFLAGVASASIYSDSFVTAN